MANKKATIAGQTTAVTVEDDILAVGGILTVSDLDPGQAYMQTVVGAAAKYGSWSVDSNGAWSYLLNSGNPAIQALGAGKTLSDSFVVTSLDGSATKKVTITIQGTNDEPVMSGQTTGSVTEDSATRATGQLTVVDPDSGQSGTTAASNIAATYGFWSVNASGQWTYRLDNANAAVQALVAGETLRDSFTVYSKDGTVSEIISITINGKDDKPTIIGEATGNVSEDGTLIATGSLTVTDKDAGQSHTQPAGGIAKYGSWSIDADGHWSYQLDNSYAKVQALGAGKVLTDTFVVTSQDGLTTKTVKVTIGGANDQPTITGSSLGAVSETKTSATGVLKVVDGDAGQSTALVESNVAASYGHYSVTAGGRWTYVVDPLNTTVKALPIGQTLKDSFEVTSHDGSTSQTVTITIAGGNHVATFSGDIAGAVIDGGATNASGTLGVDDADAGEAHTQAVSNAAATYGSWSVDADGHWSYDLDENNASVRALGTGESLSDYFNVSSADGSAQQVVTVTVGGANDAPDAPADADAAANTVRSTATPGTYVGVTLVAGDIDGDGVSYALTDNAGGRFQIDAVTGAVTVAAGAVLASGSYSVTGVASDGVAQSAPQTFTITVEEPNHAPELTANVITAAFSAAALDGWGLYIAKNGGAPERVAMLTSSPQHTQQVGDKLYFTAKDAQNGNELWTYDVSTGITSLVADIWEGKDSANPSYLTMLGSKFYFSAYNQGQAELWVFDPATQQASLAADIAVGAGSSSPQYLAAAGGKLYFSAYTSAKGSELYVYDPATNTAGLAADIRVGTSSSYPMFVTELNGKLYFNASDPTRGNELWVYNPATNTASAVDLYAGTIGSYPNHLTVVGGKLYFTASTAAHGSEIFVYDPVANATTVAVQLRQGSASAYPTDLTVLGSKIYFTALAPSNLYTLWVFDPATQAASIASDLPSGFTPGLLYAVGNQLYFSIDDGVHGRELWQFDPATGHAEMTADLTPGAYLTPANEGIEIGGKLYFHASDNVHGSELRVYDPATNKVELAVDVWPGPNGAASVSQAALGGKLYFTASDEANGTEVWVYDPATGTASLVVDAMPGYMGSSPHQLTVLDGKLYFAANDDARNLNIWVVDPVTNTANLAGLVFNGSAFPMGPTLQGMTALSGKLYFYVDDFVHGSQVWSFDPVTQTSTMVTALNIGPMWSVGAAPESLTAVNGKLYFGAYDGGDTGRELYVYDPVANTTTMVKDLVAGMFDSDPRDIIELGGKLYFGAFGDSGRELWFYDPATDAAGQVADIWPGTEHSHPTEMAVLDGKLYFAAGDPAHGSELRVYDPATGTVSLIADQVFGTANAAPRFLTVIDGKLFFSAFDATSSSQLWVYDPATQAVTKAEVVGGTPNSSNPNEIVPVVSSGMELATISENPNSNVGSAVAAILGLHGSDQDGDALGIAITGADTSHGDWQYSLDGVTWTTLGAVSDNAATLLSETARLRFVPDTNWSGTAEITIRAWDQSDGHHSGDSGVDVTIQDGEAAFSAAALQASIDVTAMQTIGGSGDAETLTGTIGADLIDAGAGADILMGGLGGDTLTGGEGADMFRYDLPSHSTLYHLDVIADFDLAGGDSIDFAALGLAGGVVDGGQIGAFGSGPAASFGGSGMIVETDGVNTRIYADTDHSGTFNAATDTVVQLTGNHLADLVNQTNAAIIV